MNQNKKTTSQDNDQDEEDEKGWMNHSLKFVKHWEDSVRTDDYVTIDPLKNNSNNQNSLSRKRRRDGLDGRRHRHNNNNKDSSSDHVPMHLRR